MATSTLSNPGDVEAGRAGSGVATTFDRVLFLCFFFSGASGLIYEVVWLRWLINLFGATTLAVSTILAAFMGGLALGSWAAGQWTARLTRPLRAYGVLELVIGGYALVLPVLLHAVVPVLRALGATEASSYAALSLARFALAVGLLTIPTACMGATLPILAQFAARRLESLGGRVGRLYAVNTAGAVLGTAGAGFVLLPAAGVGATNGIAVALNVAVGLTAVLLDWRVSPAPVLTTASDRALATVPDPVPPDDAARAGVRRAALGALGTVVLSGVVAMIYEVAWTRALALVLGSSVYAFTVMLTTFLVGLAAGSYLLARRVDRLADPGLWLGLVQLVLGAAAFLGLLVLDELPYLFLRLFALSGGRHALLLAFEFLITGTLILVPALLSGAVFPLCVRLTAAAVAGSRHHGWGRTVGNLYALNTFGAIVGSFVGGFVFIPAIGIHGTLLLAILLNLAGGFALLLTLPTRRRSLALPIALGVPACALAVPILAPEWKPLTMASGVAVYAPRFHQLSRQEFRDRREQAHLVWYEEGLTTTVSVEERGGQISLRVNGKTDASTGPDMPNQVLMGHLPMLFHPAPQDVLVVGLGSGVTVGSVLRHPVRAVTVIELERAVITASHFFDHVNFRPLEDPRTRIVVNDARNFLVLTRDHYDVIMSEPSNPWMTGAASLFTRDFFQRAKERLRPGGVFGQWIHLYGLTPEMVRTVVATFAAVFPQVTVFQTTPGDIVLVGGERLLAPDFRTLEPRIATPAVAEDLHRVQIRDVSDLMARLVLDVEDVPRFTRGAPLNTDDNARVEFTAPRTLYAETTYENAQRLADAFSGSGTTLRELVRGAPAGFTARLGERFLELGRPQQADALALSALRAGPRADLLGIAARAAAGRGEMAEAERRWTAALAVDPTEPRVSLDLAAHLEARGQLREAHALVHRARARGGGEAAMREGALLYRLGAYREAEAMLGRLPPDANGVALSLGLVRLALGDAAAAERLIRIALNTGEDARARVALAAALDQLGRSVEARQERQRAVRLDESAAAQLVGVARARVGVGHVRWAAHELERAAALTPWNLEIHRERARLLEAIGDRRAAVEAWEEIFRRFPTHALAFLEIMALWEREGDLERAREALTRYIAAEPDAGLAPQAQLVLKAYPRVGPTQRESRPVG